MTDDSTESFNVFYEQEMMEQEEDEKHLFRDLNAFISLISDFVEPSREKGDSSIRTSFESIRRRSTSLKEIKRKDVSQFTFLRYKSKDIASLLRLHLLNYLRSSQTLQQRENFPLVKEVKKREILLQWWITLLNFLSSKLKFDSLVKLNEPLEDIPTSTELVSIVLECISRIITSLIILPHHSKRDHEVYSQHLSITTKFIADILVVNSKIQKRYLRRTSSSETSSIVSSTNESADTTFTSLTSSTHNKSIHTNNNNYNNNNTNTNTNMNGSFQKNYHDLLSFLEKYSDLITTFIGKINAYAFIYLPDDYNYDYTVLSLWYPRLKREDSKDPLFPWRKSEISLVSSRRTKGNISVKKSQTGKFKSYEHQKMFASYMKNKSIFLTFYWHYWYIILRYTETKNKNYFTSENLHHIPGASLLLDFITDISLKVDLRNFDRFINGTPVRSQAHNRMGNNSSWNDTEESVNSVIPLGKRYIRNEAVNNFIFTNFGTIKLWEVLRSVSSCMSDSKYLSSMLSLHDLAILKQIKKIPAHEYTVANIIYNKIFQFILFQYFSLNNVQFINWEAWVGGMKRMLDTLNINSQTVALISYFNMWFFMPEDVKISAIRDLVFTDKYWDMLMENNQYPIIRILFIKLLVFRIIPNMGMTDKQDMFKKLRQMELKMVSLYELLKAEGVSPYIENTDPFLFALNNKFVLTTGKVNDEDYLTFDLNHRPRKPRLIAVLNNDLYALEKFPSIGSVANLRPTFVLKKGKYPYDIFDELLDNLARYKSCKKWGIKTDFPDDYFENLIYDDFDALVAKKYHGESDNTVVKNVTSTINSWFSKLSTKDEKKAPSVSRKSSVVRPSSAPNLKSSGSLRVKNETLEDKPSKPNGGWSFAFTARKISGALDKKNVKDEVTSDNTSNLGISSNSYGNIHSNGKILESLYGKLLSKQKVVVAPEIQYSKEILNNPIVTNVVKAIQLHPDGSMLEKLEKANSKWGTPIIKPSMSSSKVIQLKDDLDKNAIRVLEIPLASSSNSVLSEIVEADQTSSEDTDLKYSLPTLDLTFLEVNQVGELNSNLDNFQLNALPPAIKNATLMKYQTSYESIVKIIRVINATKNEFADFDQHNNIMIEFELYKNGHQNLSSFG
ncbi:Ahk1p RNJ42_01566 [Nakaseomyces bracarensis]|uniref:Ahk1p n=1 Tax=Nakaseomyces bracarensis TaxID=273131 RepID=UPI0038729BD1